MIWKASILQSKGDERFVVDIRSAPLSRLAISPRTLNALARAQITRVGEVLVLSDAELLGIRNFSDKCLAELDRGLANMDLRRE